MEENAVAAGNANSLLQRNPHRALNGEINLLAKVTRGFGEEASIFGANSQNEPWIISVPIWTIGGRERDDKITGWLLKTHSSSNTHDTNTTHVEQSSKYLCTRYTYDKYLTRASDVEILIHATLTGFLAIKRKRDECANARILASSRGGIDPRENKGSSREDKMKRRDDGASQMVARASTIVWCVRSRSFAQSDLLALSLRFYFLASFPASFSCGIHEMKPRVLSWYNSRDDLGDTDRLLCIKHYYFVLAECIICLSRLLIRSA